MIETINKICGHLPEGYIISLNLENGSAWVELLDSNGNYVLPDTTDKTIIEQLNDALCVANGFKE